MFNTSINLPLVKKGKIRDIYSIDDNHLLIVTTDRLSAFDVVSKQSIDNKGVVLNYITNFWFDKTKHIIPNHLTNKPIDNILSAKDVKLLKNRAVIVKKVKPLPIEAIVRGYLIGSGWKDYQKTGSICNIKLAKNLLLAEKLPNALYTPSTKSTQDTNIDFLKTAEIIGTNLALQIKNTSLKIYNFAAQYALKRNIIIADTKFEFGTYNNKLILIDEVLTPDCSRFWCNKNYKAGVNPKSFDKQIIRDYLETLNWDKTPPMPLLPNNIKQKIINKYIQLQTILCS